MALSLDSDSAAEFLPAEQPRPPARPREAGKNFGKFQESGN